MTKILVLIIALFSFTNAFCQKDSNIDVLHYTFSITVNDANDSISCSAVIQFRFLQAANNVWLDLVSRKSDGKGMKIGGIWDEESKQPLNYTHSDDIIRINWPVKTDGTKAIRIIYSGIPEDGLIISRNLFNQRTFFADNWPDRGRNWLACKDHPSDKASVDFIVTAPVHYQVVSNGALVEETNIDDHTKLTHWEEKVDLPVKVMAVGIAEFAVRYTGDAVNIPVSAWVYPANKEQGFRDFAVAEDILSYYIKNIGPYPYKKLANVQSKTIFGGMENAGAIFYDEKLVTGDGNMERLVAHEIAHQWFGDMVTEKDWPDLWLSEGFVTYLSMMYMESVHGENWMMSQLEKNKEKIIQFSHKKNTPVVDTTEKKDLLQLLNPNSYEKGGWVLHMLRRQLGDSIFWKGLRSYYGKYAGKNANTDDLRIQMELASGRDLKQFFTQWLYQPGYPRLMITHSFANKMVTVTIVQKNETLFDFPLAIRIKGSEGEVMKSVRITKRETSFTVPMDSDAETVLPDPQHSLLFEAY